MKNGWMLAVIVAGMLVGPSSAGAQPSGSGGGAGPQASLDQQLRAEAAGREAARKQELADAILAGRETAAGRELGVSLRALLKQDLLSLSLARLEAFYNSGGLGDIDAAMRDPGLNLGETAADLVFTPVTPCRVVDTRLGGGALAANTPRSFVVKGATGFGAQGGSATGCGIPTTATSVEMNFVAVGPVGPGDLRTYPYSASPIVPTASVLNYATVPGLNIANGIAQPVCNSATTTCTFDLIVQADVSGTDIVVDVVGYSSKVDRSQVKSFATLATAVTSTPVAASCGNYGGLQVTINAPVAGQVSVTADAFFLFNHATGTHEELAAFVGTSATSCPFVNGFTPFIDIPPAFPTASSYWQPVAVLSTFSVSPGSNTFFFNSLRVSGGPVNFWTGRILAEFIPN